MYKFFTTKNKMAVEHHTEVNYIIIILLYSKQIDNNNNLKWLVKRTILDFKQKILETCV